MNNLPKNFCIIPWISTETTALGNVKPCCIYYNKITDENGQPFHLSKNTMSEAFNSEYMNDLRQQFLDGKRPGGCHQCWGEEDSGKASKRIRDNQRFKHLITESIIHGKQNPRYLDIKLGNICNLKCRICGPYASSKWLAEQKHYDKQDGNDEQHKKLDWPETNHKFWQDIEEILPSVEFMDFTGGEPLLIKKHYELLEKCIELDVAKNIGLHYNTNGTQLNMKALNELWPKFKIVDCHFSIDGVGEKFEFQRHPAKWNNALSNMSIFNKKRSDKFHTQICHTVNVMNIYYLPEFLEWAESFGMDVYINSLHKPLHYNIKCLPKHIKEAVTEKLSKHDRADVRSFVSFMNSEDLSGDYWQRFLAWTQRKDQFRKENFGEVFPELNSLIQQGITA
jgi:MoaA/NifB/PqqE/SkfB family radical SAM enzyme